ncbi:MAG: cob(I)yrinic acid a,c-diamide adenosyltransferase [Leptospiraceae bacterium]|nr:cob(I)yrinic acid a,c-diamide adenosyltransferase [Leptospiraceae bacterium]MDW8306857.1 cob(I)yrinic acid a,c-diamide adenosyltransferase [Leptospiraceae bacterium]
MKIYTRTGDKGETSLFAGGRVAKNHPRVEAYGTLDEANSVIGVALSFLPEGLGELKESLLWLQKRLFDLGAELATAKQEALARLKYLVGEGDVSKLEEDIDRLEVQLVPLENFILPGGHPAAAFLHLARTVVRRGERSVMEIPNLRTQVLAFLNRSSDFLFVAARYVNAKAGLGEPSWD